MSAQEKIALYALIGDMKETIYSQMLLISALEELLQEHQAVEPAVLECKIEELKQQDESVLASIMSPHQGV